jgi:hypothetical protein
VIIDPAKVDAYIAAKGLVALVSDEVWELVLARIAELYGREVWHRTRLVTQVDDVLDR